MATSITFNSKTTSVPGVYTSIDASALASPSLGATGIVALLGPSQGGIPYTAITDRAQIKAYTSPTALAADYPAGDLLEAANLTFAASQDPAIAGGAQFVIPIKANPATQASVVLAGQSGTSITLTSQAYGYAGNGITASVAAGTTNGIKLTVSQGAIVETADNLSDEPIAKLTFRPGATGWQQMSAAVAAGTITATGGLTAAGLASELTKSALTAASAISIAANSADAGKTLSLYGLDAAGAAVVETLTLTGGPQTGAKTFAKLLGAGLSAAAAGLTLTDAAGVQLAKIAPNGRSAGLKTYQGLTVANAPAQVSASAAGETIVLAGVDGAGNAIAQALTLTQAAQATQALGGITVLALGGVVAGHTLTVNAPAAQVAAGAGLTAAMAKGALEALPGLSLLVDAEDVATPLSTLDDAAPTDIVAGPLTLTSDIQAVVDWAAANSRLVTVAAAPGSVGMPIPTTSPVSLTCGTESPATPADYLACLSLLRQVRTNTVVALSGDSAVISAVDAHCALMCGTGQSERDAKAGLSGPGGSPPTKTALLAGAAALNSRHTSLVGQSFTAYNSQNVLTTFPPPFLAAIAAGMQAGAGVGTPLTHKSAAIVSIQQDKSWSPMDDAEAMLAGGVLIFEAKDNVGIRVVRNLTTWTRDNNLAFCEASVNQAVDVAVYNFRLALEAYVGQRGFQGTVNQALVGSSAILQELQAQGIIVAFSGLQINVVGDVMRVSVSISPVLPISFILANISITLPPAFAAAA